MSVTAIHTSQNTFSGDEATDGTGLKSSNTNSNAPAVGAARQALANGDTTITLPTGFTINGVTIYPPSGNTTAIKVKGGAGDTGVRIHNTVPTDISLDSSVTTFILNAGGAMTVKLAWW